MKDLARESVAFAETYAYSDSKIGGLFTAIGAEVAEAIIEFQKWLADMIARELKRNAPAP